MGELHEERVLDIFVGFCGPDMRGAGARPNGANEAEGPDGNDTRLVSEQGHGNESSGNQFERNGSKQSRERDG